MTYGVIYRLKRFIVTSKRPSIWKKASKDAKKLHPFCAICDDESSLEAHDELPYHLILDPESKTYRFWLDNMIVLCHKCHRVHGHCRDPSCYFFQPKIRDIISFIAGYHNFCTDELLIKKRRK